MSTHSPFALARLAFLGLLLFFLLHTQLEQGAQAAPVSFPKPSTNTQIFKSLIYSGVGFNRTIMYHKDEVTSELVELLRSNPDSVLNAPPGNNTIDHS